MLICEYDVRVYGDLRYVLYKCCWIYDKTRPCINGRRKKKSRTAGRDNAMVVNTRTSVYVYITSAQMEYVYA
jgi:hypothetical protein